MIAMPLDTTLISPDVAGPALEDESTILGPGSDLVVEAEWASEWAVTPVLDAEEEDEEDEEDPFADDDDEFGADDEGDDDDDFLEDDDEDLEEDADFDDDDDDL